VTPCDCVHAGSSVEGSRLAPGPGDDDDDDETPIGDPDDDEGGDDDDDEDDDEEDTLWARDGRMPRRTFMPLAGRVKSIL
jgi:hypothetical protein